MEPGTLWIHSVPPDIVNSVSDGEKRQEAINEVTYTERDFVRDMEYLRDMSCVFLQFGTLDIIIIIHIQTSTLWSKSKTRSNTSSFLASPQIV